MSDSILCTPFYYEMMDDDMREANKKQKIYRSLIKSDKSLKKHVKTLSRAEGFNFLKKCNCCLVHQIRKPKSLDDENNKQEVVFPVVMEIKKTCKCDCRHLSRLLCRNIDLDSV